jgi:hypothetical protein
MHEASLSFFLLRAKFRLGCEEKRVEKNPVQAPCPVRALLPFKAKERSSLRCKKQGLQTTETAKRAQSF